MEADRINIYQWGRIYLVSLLWGSSFMFFEIGLEGFEPITLVFLRLAFATFFMFLLFPNRIEALREFWNNKAKLAFMGLVSCALPFAFYATGQVYVNSSTAGVINAMMPAFTFLLAVLVGQEHFRAMRLLGLAAGIAGVAMLVGPAGLGKPTEVLGAFLCLMATVCYGVYAVSAKSFAKGISPMHMSAGMIVWAAIFSLPAALVAEGIPSGQIDPVALMAACALGLFGTTIAYRIFIPLISEIGATNASISTLLIPINAIILGMLVLGEKLDAWFFAGAVTIVAAILLIDENLRHTLVSLMRKTVTTGTQ